MIRYLNLLRAALAQAHSEGLCYRAMDEEACSHYQIPDPGWIWKARVYCRGFISAICILHIPTSSGMES